MNDPHVETIEYRLVPTPGVEFNAPPDIEVETLYFRGKLSDGTLRLDMQQHFDSVEQARTVTDPYVRAWEIQAALENRRGFVLRFAHGSLIDRAPPVGDGVTVHMKGVSASVAVSDAIALHVVSGAYPAPPTAFVSSPLVEILWRRFERFKQGRESLLAMAYFVFTAVRSDAGGVREAAARYRMDEGVLKKLSELSSTRGDESDARKVEGGKALTPLSPAEHAWLSEAVRRIIAQIGTVASGHVPPRLTLAGLPSL